MTPRLGGEFNGESSGGEFVRDCFLFINELWSRRAPCPSGLPEKDMRLDSSELESKGQTRMGSGLPVDRTAISAMCSGNGFRVKDEQRFRCEQLQDAW